MQCFCCTGSKVRTKSTIEIAVCNYASLGGILNNSFQITTLYFSVPQSPPHLNYQCWLLVASISNIFLLGLKNVLQPFTKNWNFSLIFQIEITCTSWAASIRLMCSTVFWEKNVFNLLLGLVLFKQVYILGNNAEESSLLCVLSLTRLI